MTSYCREALTILTAIIHPLVPSLESATQFVMLPANSANVNQVTIKHQESNALAAETSVANQNGSEVLNGNRLLEDTVLDMSANVCESMQATPNIVKEIQAKHIEEMQIKTGFNTDSHQNKIIRTALSNQDLDDTKELMDTEANECTRQSDVYSSSKQQSTAHELTKNNAEISAADASKHGYFESDLQKDSHDFVPMTDALDDESNEVIPAKIQKFDAGEDVVKQTDAKRHEEETSIGNVRTDEV